MFPLKLITPVNPKVPACFLFLKLPNASVLSSINGIPYLELISKSLSISTNPPNEGSALQCHDMATTYNVQGFNFLWNANSIDYELYLWDFLEIK